MPIITKFIEQSDQFTCSIAVIRMIRERCENRPFSDQEVLKDFVQEVATKGTTLQDIIDYWKKYEDKYEHTVGNNQTLSDINEKSENDCFNMIILNTNNKEKFHCVFLKYFKENMAYYWDPGKHGEC